MNGNGLAIGAAAEILNVADKTIRNYIARGILQAEKWNGSWRIPLHSIQEVHWNRYGRPADLPDPRAAARGGSEDQPDAGPQVSLPRSRYDELLGEASACRALADEAERLRADVKTLHERIGRLEASSASGWTESRQYQERVKELREEIKTARHEILEVTRDRAAHQAQHKALLHRLDERQQEAAALRAELQTWKDRSRQLDEALQAARRTVRDVKRRCLLEAEGLD